MANITVRKIVAEWLKEHNYDGLCSDGCGCRLDDLMPCEDYCLNCEPGYEVPCPGSEYCDSGGGCLHHMASVKPAADAAERNE